jgi:hypothetical protein
MMDEFRRLISQPFSADMTAVEWFLFIGLLIVIIALWNFILYHLTSAIRGAA